MCVISFKVWFVKGCCLVVCFNERTQLVVLCWVCSLFGGFGRGPGLLALLVVGQLGVGWLGLMLGVVGFVLGVVVVWLA